LKRGRRLTRDEKACLQKQGLNWREYEFAYNISESYFKVRHKEKKIEKTVDRFRKAKSKDDY
jgi:hypothetical protein